MHIIQLVTLPYEKQQKDQTKKHMQERGRCKANKTITNTLPNFCDQFTTRKLSLCDTSIVTSRKKPSQCDFSNDTVTVCATVLRTVAVYVLKS
jgi:hypothetical protein